MPNETNSDSRSVLTTGKLNVNSTGYSILNSKAIVNYLGTNSASYSGWRRHFAMVMQMVSDWHSGSNWYLDPLPLVEYSGRLHLVG